MNINIKVIPHKKQRYNTPGDYWFDREGNLEIRVSKLGDSRYENCIAFHEYFEALTTRRMGVTEESISDFDMKYEAERADGFHSPYDEPGMDKNAPYRVQHQMATGVELILGTMLDVVWNDYDKSVVELIDTYEQ